MNLAVVGLEISHSYVFNSLFEEFGVKIAYVHDSDLNRAQEYSKKYGAKVIASLAEMPWDQVHGGLITSMASDHAAHSLPFLERGIPIYVTKQLAASYPDARKIVETARQKGTAMISGSVRRYTPAFRVIADHLKRGDLGDPVIVHRYEPHGIGPGTWQDKISTSGGFIVNFGVHCVESFCTLLGSDVATVSCVGGKFFHTTAESEATCVITVQFKNDAIAIAEVLAAQNPITATVPSLRVTGTKGTVEAFLDESPARRYRGAPLHDPASYEYLSGNRDTVIDIVQMMKTKKQPMPYDDLLAVSRILAMARISYEQKKTVHASEFPA